VRRQWRWIRRDIHLYAGRDLKTLSPYLFYAQTTNSRLPWSVPTGKACRANLLPKNGDFRSVAKGAGDWLAKAEKILQMLQSYGP
jgi:hypothetical protein